MGFEFDPYGESGPVTHQVVNASDTQKLRWLADWFDVRDRQEEHRGTEVQDDLRRIADLLERMS